MISKYRLWCNTENDWVYTDWSVSPPNKCPNNESHTIDSDSIVSVASSSDRNILLSIGGSSGECFYECNSSDWEVVRKFHFLGTDILGSVRGCSIIANTNSAGNPGLYKLYDYTNNLEICNWIINKEEFSAVVTNTLINLPTSPAIFEIQGKSSGNLMSNEHTKITTFLLEFE